jgi:hypothetical protein
MEAKINMVLVNNIKEWIIIPHTLYDESLTQKQVVDIIADHISNHLLYQIGQPIYIDTIMLKDYNLFNERLYSLKLYKGRRYRFRSINLTKPMAHILNETIELNKDLIRPITDSDRSHMEHDEKFTRFYRFISKMLLLTTVGFYLLCK